MIKAAWLAQFQATGCWSKGDSNRESLRDAFVNVWHLPRSSRPNVSFRKPRRANSQMPLTALQSTWSKREPATVRYRVDTGLPASRGERLVFARSTRSSELWQTVAKGGKCALSYHFPV